MVKKNYEAWEAGLKTIMKRAKMTASFQRVFGTDNRSIESLVGDIYTIGFNDGEEAVLKKNGKW